MSESLDTKRRNCWGVADWMCPILTGGSPLLMYWKCRGPTVSEYETTTVLPTQVPNGGVLLLAREQRREGAARVRRVVPARRVVGATIAYRVVRRSGPV